MKLQYCSMQKLKSVVFQRTKFMLFFQLLLLHGPFMVVNMEWVWHAFSAWQYLFTHSQHSLLTNKLRFQYHLNRFIFIWDNIPRISSPEMTKKDALIKKKRITTPFHFVILLNLQPFNSNEMFIAALTFFISNMIQVWRIKNTLLQNKQFLNELNYE